VTGPTPHQREPKPWRNELPPEPLPEPRPDKWQWRANEVVYGPDPKEPTWLPVQAEPKQATNG
jgi:hypothetical protein